MPNLEDHVTGLLAKAANADKSEDAMRFSQAANNASNAIFALNDLAGRKPDDEIVGQMVNRFLSWKFPVSISPDGGFSFDPAKRSSVGSMPTGTNLLSATQAEAMIRRLLGQEAK